MASLGTASLDIRLGLAKFNRNLDTFEQRTMTTFQKVEARAQRMKRVGQTMSLAVTAPLAAIAGLSIKAASDAEETRSKFQTVFRDIGDSAEQGANRLRTSFGLSGTAARQLLGDTGDLLTGFGFAQESALDLSQQVAELAVDLASFTNYSGGAAGASAALTKALLGERESLKSLGISIMEADVQAQALINSQQGMIFETERQAKAFATLQLAQQQSGNAIGDYARTSDSAANQMRLFAARTQELREALGEGLLPVFVPLVTKATEWVTKLAEMDESSRNTVLVLGGLAAATGPVLIGFASIVQAIPNIVAGFRAIRLAALALAGPAGILLALAAVLGVTLYRALQDTRTTTDEATKSFQQFTDGTIPAKAAVNELTEAVDENGLMGAVEALGGTLSEDSRSDFEDFARNHLPAIIAQGELQDAIDATLVKYAQLQAEDARTQLQTTRSALKEARESLRVMERAMASGATGIQGSSETFAQTAQRLRDEITSLNTQQGYLLDLLAGIGDAEHDFASGLITAEQRAARFRETIEGAAEATTRLLGAGGESGAPPPTPTPTPAGAPPPTTPPAPTRDITLRSAETAKELFGVLADMGADAMADAERLGGTLSLQLQSAERRADFLRVALERATDIEDMTAGQFAYLEARLAEIERRAENLRQGMEVSQMGAPGKAPERYIPGVREPTVPNPYEADVFVPDLLGPDWAAEQERRLERQQQAIEEVTASLARFGATASDTRAELGQAMSPAQLTPLFRAVEERAAAIGDVMSGWRDEMDFTAVLGQWDSSLDVTARQASLTRQAINALLRLEGGDPEEIRRQLEELQAVLIALETKTEGPLTRLKNRLSEAFSPLMERFRENERIMSEFRSELAVIDGMAAHWGEDYDAAGARVTLLTNTINTLIRSAGRNIAAVQPLLDYLNAELAEAELAVARITQAGNIQGMLDVLQRFRDDPRDLTGADWAGLVGQGAAMGFPDGTEQAEKFGKKLKDDGDDFAAQMSSALQSSANSFGSALAQAIISGDASGAMQNLVGSATGMLSQFASTLGGPAGILAGFGINLFGGLLSSLFEGNQRQGRELTEEGNSLTRSSNTPAIEYRAEANVTLSSGFTLDDPRTLSSIRDMARATSLDLLRDLGLIDA